MAARTLVTADQDGFAREVLGCARSTANPGQQADIDECARKAINKVNQVAQFFAYTGRTADAAWSTGVSKLDIGEFFSWWAAEAALQLAYIYKKDQIPALQARVKDAMLDATASYTTYTAGGAGIGGTAVSNSAATLTLNGIRAYVVGHLIRRDRPVYPDVALVDGVAQDVINELWNMTGWPFRRRQVELRITEVTFSTGNWVESTKVISNISTTGFTFVAGARAYLTGGTGVTVGEYVIASTASTTLTLASSCATAGASLTNADIAGSLYTVAILGMESGEAFDSVASRSFLLRDSATTTDTGLLRAAPAALQFVDADSMATLRARSSPTGRPYCFRLQSNAGTRSWQLYPWPDDTYRYFGEVFIAGPTLPADATATTAYDKFPIEFRPVIREMTLSKVLSKYGQSYADEDRLKRSLEQLLERYDDHGTPDDDQGVRDVYGDYEAVGGRFFGDGGV